jgi:hypothetical protein
MAYESFHYGKTFEEAMTDKAAFTEILRLPISIMAVSRGVQTLLKDRVGVESYYVPHGIESQFYLRPLKPFSESPKRILMVGSYLSPWKGMTAGFEAIERLSKQMALNVVLLTQPTINRNIFDKYTFPVEFHCRPDLDQVAEIYTSCHVHLCCSWHEGTGMPTLECMNCGVPVIATKNDGVSEFAIDGENILLVEKNNSDDIYNKLEKYFSNQKLAAKLHQNGAIAMKSYTWENCFELFKAAQSEIFENSTPIKVDINRMQQLMSALEEQGLYTPLNVYRELNSLDKQLQTVCEQLSNRQISAESAVEKLGEIKDALTPYVRNEQAEYHHSFRAPYDLCRMLLSLKGDPKFADYAAVITSKRKSARPAP